jgi:hypothetical protein
MHDGDKVVAIRRIDGFMKRTIPEGTKGVVVHCLSGRRMDVEFRLHGVFLGSRHLEVVRVAFADVAKI